MIIKLNKCEYFYSLTYIVDYACLKYYKSMNSYINHISKIQKAIRENTLVVFIGAGVSANSGVPTWGNLINKMASELNIEREIQQSEYLKIAQYYYNNCPKNFFKNVKNFLEGEWKPNIIHEYLFKEFSPQYFVTTNYDDLLEQTSNKLSIPYTIIAQDEDIPTIGNDNAVIKMHGDFKHNKIVLKEDDYLKYSENYRLMEVFIKSLFATNTVLFVGFSADDSNVNQIYSWVNNILDKNQREAYLIQIDEVNKDYELKRNYFNKKGIHLLNYNELANDINIYIKDKYLDEELKTLTEERGKQLYKLLHYIKNSTPNILEHCYQKLLPTKHLNFVSDNDITNILDDFWGCYYGTLSTSHDKKMGEFINLLKKRTKKAKLTKELLTHLGIKKIIEQEWVKEKIVTKNELNLVSVKKQDCNILDLINEFNYIKVEKYLGNINDEKYIDNYIDKNIDSVNVFEKVYILLKLHRYESAYNLLKRISYKAKEKGNNFIFIISEFNKKVAFNYYYWDCFYDSSDRQKEELRKLEKDCWAINIPNLIKKLLSDEEKNVIEDKLNFKFIEKLDKKILKDSAEDSQTEFCLKQLCNTYMQNYIFIDNYQEFQKLCMHSISSEFKNINNQENSNKIKIDLTNSYSNKYDFLDLILIIRYAKTSDLHALIYKYKIKKLILNQPSVKNRLLSAYNNLINSIIHYNLCKNCSHGNKYLEYLYKFFIIFSVLPLTKKDITNIIKQYLNLIEKYNWYEDFYTTDNLLFYILNLIIRNYNTYGNAILDCNILGKFLIYIVNNSNKIKEGKLNQNRIVRFVTEISSIIKEINPNIEIPLFNISEQTDFSAKLYAFIYKVSHSKTKNKIKECITSQLNDNFNHELYQNACIEDIIKPNLKYEKKLVQEIENRIKKYSELKNTQPTTCNGFTNNPIGLDEIHDVLRTVSNLLNFEKLKTPKLFEQYKNHKDFVTYDYFSFTLDMRTFEYNKFKINFLGYLTKSKQKQLKQIINADAKKKQIIKEKFLNQISLNNDINNRLRDKTLNLLFDEPIVNM